MLYMKDGASEQMSPNLCRWNPGNIHLEYQEIMLINKNNVSSVNKLKLLAGQSRTCSPGQVTAFLTSSVLYLEPSQIV